MVARLVGASSHHADLSCVLWAARQCTPNFTAARLQTSYRLLSTAGAASDALGGVGGGGSGLFGGKGGAIILFLHLLQGQSGPRPLLPHQEAPNRGGSRLWEAFLGNHRPSCQLSFLTLGADV